MAYIILTVPICLLFFLFVYGAAPCWQFERLCKKKFNRIPDDGTLIGLGLTPASRRLRSLLLFMAISAILLVLVVEFSEEPEEDLIVVGLISMALGSMCGYLLHHLGTGSKKIKMIFERL